MRRNLRPQGLLQSKIRTATQRESPTVRLAILRREQPELRLPVLRVRRPLSAAVAASAWAARSPVAQIPRQAAPQAPGLVPTRPLRLRSRLGRRRRFSRRCRRGGFRFGRLRQRLLGGFQNAVGELNHMALMDQPVQIRNDGGLFRRRRGALRLGHRRWFTSGRLDTPLARVTAPGPRPVGGGCTLGFALM